MSDPHPDFVGIVDGNDIRVAILAHDDFWELVERDLDLDLMIAAKAGRAHEFLIRYNVPFTIPEEDISNDGRQTS